MIAGLAVTMLGLLVLVTVAVVTVMENDQRHTSHLTRSEKVRANHRGSR